MPDVSDDYQRVLLNQEEIIPHSGRATSPPPPGFSRARELVGGFGLLRLLSPMVERIPAGRWRVRVATVVFFHGRANPGGTLLLLLLLLVLLLVLLLLTL